MRLFLFSRSCMLTALVVGSWACGSNTATLDPYTEALEHGIIDGTKSTMDDYPATGVILFTADQEGEPFGSMLCSATLIAPDVIMAAAHCDLSLFVHTSKPPEYYFSLDLDVSRFGANGDMTLPPHTTKIAALAPHPDFNLRRVGTGLRHTYDIALMFLEKPVTEVLPARVIAANEARFIKVGANAAIVGYGRRHEEARRRDAGVKYHGLTKVNEVGKFEMQISVGSPQPHKCHGDSGGPTYMSLGKGRAARLVLAGITSHAYDHEDCAHGGVDTRIDPYLDWLDETLQASCADGTRPACPDSAYAAGR